MEATTEPKKKKGVALAGVNAGSTAICTVGHTGNDYIIVATISPS